LCVIDVFTCRMYAAKPCWSGYGGPVDEGLDITGRC
jgi:hypothetical protein